MIAIIIIIMLIFILNHHHPQHHHHYHHHNHHHHPYKKKVKNGNKIHTKVNLQQSTITLKRDKNKSKTEIYAPPLAATGIHTLSQQRQITKDASNHYRRSKSH